MTDEQQPQHSSSESDTSITHQSDKDNDNAHDGLTQALQRFKNTISSVVLGQDAVIEQTLITLLAGGHVLIEGVPGLGKTLLVRCLAKGFGGKFARIQFTPDLMPSDVTGHAMYDMQSQQFKIRRGPAFTNLLLADEINRAPAKTQAALLEVMQEQQITIEGQALTTPKPFMVLATQNPIEQEGTYPLPEAELDRFMLKIKIDYPSHADEKELVNHVTTGRVQDDLHFASDDIELNPDDILELQKRVANIPIDDQVLDYAVRLVRSTRDWPGIEKGAGPRGAIALVRCSRAQAFLAQRDFVIPDDVKQVAIAALRHRIALSAELELEGLDHDAILQRIIDQTDAPRL